MSKRSNVDIICEIGASWGGGFGAGFGAVVGTAMFPVVGTVIGAAVGAVWGAAAGGGVGACIGSFIDALNIEEIEDFLYTHEYINNFILWITGNRWGVIAENYKSEEHITSGVLTPSEAQQFREKTGMTRGVNKLRLDRQELEMVMGF